jgi:hypothetical protein
MSQLMTVSAGDGEALAWLLFCNPVALLCGVELADGVQVGRDLCIRLLYLGRLDSMSCCEGGAS